GIGISCRRIFPRHDGPVIDICVVGTLGQLVQKIPGSPGGITDATEQDEPFGWVGRIKQETQSRQECTDNGEPGPARWDVRLNELYCGRKLVAIDRRLAEIVVTYDRRGIEHAV